MFMDWKTQCCENKFPKLIYRFETLPICILIDFSCTNFESWAIEMFIILVVVMILRVYIHMSN